MGSDRISISNSEDARLDDSTWVSFCEGGRVWLNRSLLMNFVLISTAEFEVVVGSLLFSVSRNESFSAGALAESKRIAGRRGPSVSVQAAKKLMLE